jgi:hypothetical protein
MTARYAKGELAPKVNEAQSSVPRELEF